MTELCLGCVSRSAAEYWEQGDEVHLHISTTRIDSVSHWYESKHKTALPMTLENLLIFSLVHEEIHAIIYKWFGSEATKAFDEI